ncbi:hypothetical protein JQR88_06120 [Pseudomonas luteola]|uniref:hypothetical protein n=1 Tax=Pseudomonas luteola TaxID=47886 RepID=UPI003DA133BD
MRTYSARPPIYPAFILQAQHGILWEPASFLADSSSGLILCYRPLANTDHLRDATKMIGNLITVVSHEVMARWMAWRRLPAD